MDQSIYIALPQWGELGTAVHCGEGEEDFHDFFIKPEVLHKEARAGEKKG